MQFQSHTSDELIALFIERDNMPEQKAITLVRIIKIFSQIKAEKKPLYPPAGTVIQIKSQVNSLKDISNRILSLQVKSKNSIRRIELFQKQLDSFFKLQESQSWYNTH